MRCPRCNTVLDDDTAFCGNCGTQIAPLHAQGATVAASIDDDETLRVNTNAVRNRQPAQPPVIQGFSPHAAPYIPSPDTPPQNRAPQAPRRGKSPLASARGRIIIALALIVLVGGGLGLFVTLRNNGGSTNLGANATGQIAFSDSSTGLPGHTDALTMNIQKLEAPPSGSQYDAWLVNDASEQITALGSLTANGSTFSLSYAGDAKNGQAGTNLIGAGNKVEVTLEQGSVNAPTGRVILSATFPPKAFIHIRHLLFSFPITPGKIGLLVGLLGQVQLLNTQAVLLQNASASHNTLAVQCASQSIIDIIEGAQGSAFQQLPPSCFSVNVGNAGDGFGMLGNTGYVLLASEHASLAATQSDATDNIRLNAGHVEVAMSNIKGWVTKIEQDALALRATPGNTTAIQEMVTLSDRVLHGVDTNGDGRVDPVAGESGAITGYDQGQLMATLQFVAGA
ncbi:MAG: zinc-ribbon domain-containing protein [Ktedonobacteraceae bacterium]